MGLGLLKEKNLVKICFFPIPGEIFCFSHNSNRRASALKVKHAFQFQAFPPSLHKNFKIYLTDTSSVEASKSQMKRKLQWLQAPKRENNCVGS